mgnify:CR=1 FL=1
MMKDLLWAESQKLYRSKILWIAGFATVMVGLIVFAQGQFTFYDRRYIDGAGWFMTAAQSLATFYVLPAVISLLGSYMICREEQEDTLKSLRLIPVDEVKLTLAKMILAFVFSVLIYLLLFAITFLVEAVLHFKSTFRWPCVRKSENIFSGWGRRILCNFAYYRSGSADEKGVLAGSGICRNIFVCWIICEYVPAVKDGISHDSRFQYLWLL